MKFFGNKTLLYNIKGNKKSLSGNLVILHLLKIPFQYNSIELKYFTSRFYGQFYSGRIDRKIQEC